MKLKIEVDCSPEEARSFLGLPDVTGLNAHLVDVMKARMDQNMASLQPDELFRSWMAMGGQATEQFRKLMTAAATAGLGGTRAE